MRWARAIVVSALLTGSVWPAAAIAQEDGTDLVIRLQAGLYRVGCLTREPDGVWGATSKAALSEFARKVGQRLIGLGPTLEALQLVDQYDEQVCSLQYVMDAEDESVDLLVEEIEPPAPSEDSKAAEVDLATPAEPAPAESPRPVSPPKPVVSCIIATVDVGPKPGYGDRWDFPKKAPDVDFREVTTGSSNYCNDSYRCQLRLMTSAETLSFQIEDDDQTSNNDPIGSGQCTVGAQCNLAPAASVSIAPCS